MHTSTPYNEKRLLLKASQGDEVAFSRLFYAYHNRLGAYLYRLTGSFETAEEIIQEVFVKVWTNREVLPTIDCFRSYIYVLSRNHALNFLRQLAKERMRKRQIIENLKQQFSESYDNDSTNTSSDYFLLIDQAVEELPPQQQKAYILSKREGLKYEEIAQKMEISRETVKSYLKLATRFVTSYVRTHGDLMSIFLLYLLSLSLL